MAGAGVLVSGAAELVMVLSVLLLQFGRSAALLKESPSDRGPITIRADARSTHQAVVTAMDVAGRLGFSQLNIATVHEEPVP